MNTLSRDTLSCSLQFNVLAQFGAAHKPHKNRRQVGFSPWVTAFQTSGLGTWGRGRPRKTGTRGENFFLLQCLSEAIYWRSLASYQLKRGKYLKGPDPFSHIRQQRLNLMLRDNKLITHIATMVEIIAKKGPCEFLAQSFD